MDGYGYKFNELPAKEKLTSINYVTRAIVMKPPLFSCGCNSLLFGSYGRPPMQRPINNFLPHSQAFFCVGATKTTGTVLTKPDIAQFC